MQKHYQLLNVDDLQRDEASIIEILSAIKNNRLRSEIRLLNYYRELPLIFDATIETLDRGTAEMKVHDLQAAAMMIEHETFIKCDHLAHDVVAKVLRVKKEENLAILGSFHYAVITAERRLSVRVKVSEQYDATFHCRDQLVRGRIEDISFGGVSIAAPAKSALEENATGVVCIALPGSRLEVCGRLLKIDERDSSSSYIIEMEVDGKSERMISQFIFSQQSQIIRELKDHLAKRPGR